MRAAGRRVMRPELDEEVSGIATGLVAAMALVGLSPERAMAELHRRIEEILKRDGLSPGEIAYLRGKIENWPPGYAEQWAIGYANGLAKGKAKTILTVLEVRRLPVSDDIRDRVTTCADLARLDDWLDRVGTVERAEDLFAADPEVVPGSAPEQG
ncbi:hypothetical protein [Streptomyces sp. SID12488]|uniref:hypothetical protein n=1 Tax=Streptomyces sp. SID12488 TaxID=2706040 RepID=UPI001EF3CC83|nr:hypothetical protein [Streptomyces sp. SID12488]